MDLIVYLILLFVSGLVIGALARLAIPGPDPMTVTQTALVGIAGSFIAGLIWLAISGHNGGGILLSVIVSAVIVYLIRRSRGGDLSHPGTYSR